MSDDERIREVKTLLARPDDIKKVLELSRSLPSDWSEGPLHEIIRWFRRRLQLTQTDFAAKVGLERRQIVRLEKGEHDPRWSTIQRAFAALGCSVMVVPVTDKSIEELQAQLGTTEPAWERRLRRWQLKRGIL